MECLLQDHPENQAKIVSEKGVVLGERICLHEYIYDGNISGKLVEKEE